MKITHEFAVTRPVEAVWGFFQDVPAVAQCLPGAELTADKGNNTYGGKVSVKLGPLTAVFEGDAVVTSNSQAHTAVIDGTGVDRRGGSRGGHTVEQGGRAQGCPQRDRAAAVARRRRRR